MSSVNYLPDLEERLTPEIGRAQRTIDRLMQSLRVAMPAVVQSFQPGPPATVTVQPALREYVQINKSAPDAVNLATFAVDLPVLADVPVVFPSAGGWSLTMPIRPGDECYIIFADGAIDIWWQNGGTANSPISQRRHSLSDAVAVFGLRSAPQGLSNYSTSSMQLRSDDGAVMIDLAPGGITVNAPQVTVNCPSGTVAVNAKDATISATDRVTIGSATTIDGRVFLSHSHGGVAPGTGNTGGVI